MYTEIQNIAIELLNKGVWESGVWGASYTSESISVWGPGWGPTCYPVRGDADVYDVVKILVNRMSEEHSAIYYAEFCIGCY